MMLILFSIAAVNILRHFSDLTRKKQRPVAGRFFNIMLFAPTFPLVCGLDFDALQKVLYFGRVEQCFEPFKLGTHIELFPLLAWRFVTIPRLRIKLDFTNGKLAMAALFATHVFISQFPARKYSETRTLFI